MAKRNQNRTSQPKAVPPRTAPSADEREWIVRDAELKILGRVTAKTHRSARSAARAEFGDQVQVELALEVPARAAETSAVPEELALEVPARAAGTSAVPGADAQATQPPAETVSAPATPAAPASSGPVTPPEIAPAEAAAPTAAAPAAQDGADHSPTTPATPDTKAKPNKPRKSRTEPETSSAAAPPKRLSAIDAAERLLREEGRSMNCQEMIEAMARKGYWQSPGGKTPSATLYSALLRELARKGDQARFEKAERGQFRARPRPE